MRRSNRPALILLMSGAAAPALAEYRPISEAVLGAPLVAPGSPGEVSAMCDKRIAAIRGLQATLEAMPLSTSAPDLLAAYDDLYNLTGSAAFTEPPLIDERAGEGLSRQELVSGRLSRGAGAGDAVSGEA